MTSTLAGGCHCGNLALVLHATRAAAELPARACMCTFCTPRRLRWTADPQGHVEITVTDARELSRYRFGTATADFLVCRRCGSVVAALTTGDAPKAIVNLDVLATAADFPEPTAHDFDGEDVERRAARRDRNWTPATLRGA